MANKHNILYVQPNAKLGGSFQSLYYLLKNIDKSRYETTVLLPQYNRSIVKKLKNVNSNVLISPFPAIGVSINFKYRLLSTSIVRFILLNKYYLRRLPDISADIIHLNSLNSVFGLVLARRLNLPIVWHVREQIPYVFGGHLRNYFLHLLRDDIVKDIICISENEAHHLPEKKVHIIHNFYRLYPEPLPNRKPIKFLSIGSFTVDKGFWLLIDVVKYLCKRYSPLDFKIGLMGITSTITILKKILREKNIDHFKSEIKKYKINDYFELYPQNFEITPKFFAKFHVLVRPSLHNDPWGRDIIEAMSVGRALIATGNYDKFVRSGENGFLIPYANPVDLADRMQLFIENEKLAYQFGNNSYNIAKKHFCPEENTKKIENIYKKLAVRAI